MRPIIKPKTNTMKKLFAILAIAGALASCNNGDADKTTTDTTKTVVVDATKNADSANKMMNKMADTAKKMIDTASKMMDKAADKMKDATNKMVEKTKEPVKH